jgi:hypothetical protein
MTPDISIALIGVASALFGTTAGGLISYYANKEIRRTEWRSSIIREEINEKKKIYSDYLSEATRLAWIGVENKSDTVREFHPLSNLAARIELVGSEKVVEASKMIMDHVLSLHTENKKTMERTFFEVKTVFINEVKQEIYRLQNKKI